MSSRPAQTINVTCPACRTPYTAQVISVIDVGSNPRLKTLLLQGRLNVGMCPQCGTAGILSVPLVYHDSEKQLLFCLVPQELGLRESDRQRVIGEMTRAIINSLPTEMRKGYLLQPRIFLTFPTLIEAVLEADGITREMLQAQEKKAELIQRMAQSAGDTLGLASMIAENKDLIDQEFFVILSTSVQAALRNGQTEPAERMNVLLEKLLQQTPVGQEIARQQEQAEKALKGIDENMTQEELVNRVLSIEGDQEDEILGLLISVARPLVDYRFFQLLTERVEKAEQAGDGAFVAKAKELRAKVLDITQRLDSEAQSAMQEKAELLSEIAQSQDARSVIRAHLEEIDQAFFSILEINIQESMRRNDTENAEALQKIKDTVTEVLGESWPPELLLVQKLLRASYPDETRQMLQDNPTMVTPEWIRIMKQIAAQLNLSSQKASGEHLEKVIAQAQLMVGMAE